MKAITLSLLTAVVLTGCAGFTERLPHYVAIADSALKHKAAEDAKEEVILDESPEVEEVVE